MIVRDRIVVGTAYGRHRPASATAETVAAPGARAAAPPRGIYRCVCAEQNALVQAAYHGIAVRDDALYRTHQQCLTYARLLISAGIARADCQAAGGDPATAALLQEAKIPLTRV